MSNTLTNLMPDAYAALDVVSRELVGAIPAVARDATADRAALNQVIRDPITPSNTTSDITPAMTPPTPAGQTISNRTLSITKSKFAAFSWTGDEQQQVNAGPGILTIQQDQIAQAMRALVNEMEADIAALHIYASRAYGTAGVTPFASTLGDPAQVRKILDDNGTPVSDRHLIIDTTAGATMRTLAQLTKANEAGDTTMLRQGVLLDIHGFSIRESAQIKTSVAGTGASATTNNAGYAVGATTLTLAAAGTGTLIAGDIVTFAGDTNKYLVVSGSADVSAGGTLVLAAPGLKVAMSAATKAITVVAAATRNLAFSRNALAMACRLPALPKDGDLATDRTTITDPRSSISFELAYYPGFRMGGYFIGAAWGVAAMKPEHLCLLLG
jgi:hypothetical protein